MRRLSLVTSGLLLAGLAAVPAQAAFHLMSVREVFPGTTAEPSAQYVELQMYAGGQNFVGGHAVRVYNAAGTQVASFSFAGNVSNGANQATILIATPQAQSLFGVAPDLVMTASIPLAGGAVCFDTIDCLTWGSYSPGSAPDGSTQPLNPSEGLIASSSATRDISAGNPAQIEFGDDTGSSAADFDFLGPSPRNNAGSGGIVPGCTLTYAAQTVTASESAPSVTLTANGCAGVTASYATADLTATAGADYTASSGSVTFGSGTQVSITIGLIDDAAYEGASESFAVRLRAPSSGAYLANPTASVVLAESSAPPSPPSAPRDLAATGGIAQIALTWQPPLSTGGAPVTGYRVYGGHSSGALALLADLGDVLAFTETELGNGVTRYYQVSAVSSVGEGDRSNEAVATTDPEPAIPSAPQSFTATAGIREIVVSWAAPASDGGSPVLGYRLYEGGSPVSLGLVADVSPSTLGLTRTGLPNGATRYYRVLAYNATGAGTPSGVTSATTWNLPSAARSLTATGGNGRVSLAWLAPTSNGGTVVTGYRIYRGTTAGQETPLTTVGAVLSYVDTGLPPGAFRSYRVSAINAVGEGSLSVTATATTFSPPGPPQRPQAVPGAAIGDVLVSWDAPLSTGGSPLTTYVVYRSSGSAPEAEVGRTTGETFTDRGLSPGTKYLYRVTAVNAVGEGAPSATVCNRPYPWLNTIGCIV